MDKLGEALARLEQAVARLEAAAPGERRDSRSSGAREIDDAELREIADEVAARIDGALAKIGRILGEGG